MDGPCFSLGWRPVDERTEVEGTGFRRMDGEEEGVLAMGVEPGPVS